MPVIVTVPPTREEILALVTLEKFKQAKRISHSMEDGLLEDFLVDAFQYFDGPDGWLNRAILPQTWKYTRSAFTGLQYLPGAPLRSVESVAYLDALGVSHTIDPINYRAITFGAPFGVISSAFVWPSVGAYNDGVTITFKAGWDAPGQSPPPVHGQVPGPIVRAIYLLAGTLYENREATFEDNRISTVSRKIEYGIDKLAGRWKILNDPNGGGW